ncbi:methylated-DNA--[protein]-cysteine S-methyltransferase [Streptomyces caniscabiei]|uniref:methylated-DNA--[protein]-cysteine S-methyltransferase n=1 Tax=Streptomyces caniscabiei TaxID=2746961 RepID=UPI0029B4F709|nr:methylated-DNA--[protein]-cysteine S-methyltransferase [Streptomyces caniscabiei]MDX2776643.1 methylated-DNA--[protein]-cysteine S-methyltransferase [Streptomyces caniscabiei]
MYYTYYDTPAGTLLLTDNDDVLTGVYWKVFARSPKVLPNWHEDKSRFTDVIRQFDEYFAGTRTSFDLTYEAPGTDFQKSVWREIAKIPYGTRITYKDIADAIGKPKAVRAVGTAVGSNPISIAVPCHRVLATSGKLGGYAGGLDSKRTLLAVENITYVDEPYIERRQ